MIKFIIGLVIILFSNTISYTLPSFLGYALIAYTFRQYKDESKYFDGLVYPTAIVMVLSAFTFALDILNIAFPFAWLRLIYVLIIMITNIVILYGIVMGWREIETREALHFDSDRPMTACHYYTITTLFILLSTNSTITSVAHIAELASIVYVVYTFYNTAVLYKQKRSFD